MQFLDWWLLARCYAVLLTPVEFPQVQLLDIVDMPAVVNDSCLMVQTVQKTVEVFAQLQFIRTVVVVPVVLVLQAPQLHVETAGITQCRSLSTPHLMAVVVRMGFFARFTGIFRTPSFWTLSAGWRGRRELAPGCSATRIRCISLAHIDRDMCHKWSLDHHHHHHLRSHFGSSARVQSVQSLLHRNLLRKLIRDCFSVVLVSRLCLAVEVQIGCACRLDGAVMVAATLAGLLDVATRQTRLPPLFPAAFGVKYVVSLPVALGGQSGPNVRDDAATELEGLCVLHEGEILEDEAVGCGSCSALVWAVAQFAFMGAMNVVWMPVLLELAWAAAEVVKKGAVIVFLVLVLLELVKAAAEVVLKGAVIVVLVPVLLELVKAAAENGSKGAAFVSLAPVFLEAAASFLGKTLGVCEFPGHIWKGDRKNKGKRFFRVQTSGKYEDQVSSFGILGNVNVAHIVRELWMERQENYIYGEVRTAAAFRAAAFEGVLPLFLGFPVPVFVTAMPVQAVATGSVGITTLEGETDRSPSQEPYGSQASRSLGQQEDSGKVSHDEKF